MTESADGSDGGGSHGNETTCRVAPSIAASFPVNGGKVRGAGIAASPALDALIQRRSKPAATFRELVQRCAQFLNLLATHSGYRRRYCRCCSRGFIPRGLRTLAAE